MQPLAHKKNKGYGPLELNISLYESNLEALTNGRTFVKAII